MGTFTHLRYEDWRIRWIEFIKDSLDLASDLCLNWDDITCTQWTGDGIEAITGHNPYDPWRGKHKGILGACKEIKKAGFNSLDDLIASLFTEVPVSMAHQGDLILTRTQRWISEGDEGALFAEEVMPHGVALADPPIYWGVTEQGFAKGDLYADAVRAFAVGRIV